MSRTSRRVIEHPSFDMVGYGERRQEQDLTAAMVAASSFDMDHYPSGRFQDRLKPQEKLPYLTTALNRTYATPTSLVTFKTLKQLLGLAPRRLLQALEGQSEWTLLAPTDGAFDKMKPSQLFLLKNHPNELQQFLLGHMVSRHLDLADLRALRGKRLRMLDNKEVLLQPAQATDEDEDEDEDDDEDTTERPASEAAIPLTAIVFGSDARVVCGNIGAALPSGRSRGTVHGIDHPLLSADMSAALERVGSRKTAPARRRIQGGSGPDVWTDSSDSTAATKAQLWHAYQEREAAPSSNTVAREQLVDLPSIYITPEGWAGQGITVYCCDGRMIALVYTSSWPPSETIRDMGAWPDGVPAPIAAARMPIESTYSSVTNASPRAGQRLLVEVQQVRNNTNCLRALYEAEVCHVAADGSVDVLDAFGRESTLRVDADGRWLGSLGPDLRLLSVRWQ